MKNLILAAIRPLSRIGVRSALVPTFSLLLILLPGCGDPKESARKELAKLGKDYNSASFIESVANGDSLAIKLFLAAGINVNEPTGNGTTALMSAANRVDSQLVQMLLDKGANPDAQNADGLTALMVATSKLDQETILALLGKGANPNIAKSNGVTALIIAATAGNADVVKTLLEKTDANSAMTSEGVSPLIAAAMGQHLDVAKLLLAKGANVTAKDSSGLTASDYATNLGMVKLLRDHGAPVVTDYVLKRHLQQFGRELTSQAKSDMENGKLADTCRKLVVQTLSQFEQEGFTSNQLFQARTCASDALSSAINSLATSGINSPGAKSKAFIEFREELGKGWYQ